MILLLPGGHPFLPNTSYSPSFQESRRKPVFYCSSYSQGNKTMWCVFCDDAVPWVVPQDWCCLANSHSPAFTSRRNTFARRWRTSEEFRRGPLSLGEANTFFSLQGICILCYKRFPSFIAILSGYVLEWSHVFEATCLCMFREECKENVRPLSIRPKEWPGWENVTWEENI